MNDECLLLIDYWLSISFNWSMKGFIVIGALALCPLAPRCCDGVTYAIWACLRRDLFLA